MNSIRAGMLILTLILGQHIVQPGEWLYSISRAYGVDPGAIAVASGITMNQVIHPGRVLTIPDVPKYIPPGPTAARQFGTGQVAVPVDGPLPRITPLLMTVPVAAPTVTTPAPAVPVQTTVASVSPGQVTVVKYSHYWPPLGGPNCAIFVDGQCISRMASGLRWQDYIGVACACPPSWPFWTKVILDGQTWYCLDRGGMVKYDWTGKTYVDFLAPSAAYGYGSFVTVQVIFP